MSSCMFQSIVTEFQDIYQDLYEGKVEFAAMSDEELRAFYDLLATAERLGQDADEYRTQCERQRNVPDGTLVWGRYNQVSGDTIMFANHWDVGYLKVMDGQMYVVRRPNDISTRIAVNEITTIDPYKEKSNE